MALAEGDAERVAAIDVEWRKYSDKDLGFLSCATTYATYHRNFRGVFAYNDWTKQGGGNINYGVPDWRLPNDAKVAILGDWGTGLPDAKALLRDVMVGFKPAAIIHLGDIYYSGTTEECQLNYADIFTEVFDETLGPGRRIPVFTLAGNHDYYALGWGFYDTFNTMNAAIAGATQDASYFSLRTEDGGWQFLGMDTGYFDSNPVEQYDPTYAGPWLHPSEVTWMQHKLDTFKGATILLSHHQLFSSNSKLNGSASPYADLPYLNPYLYRTFMPYFRKGVAGWLWGHEHNLVIYRDWLFGLQKGRLVGCSAFEELVSSDPYKVNYPQVPYLDPDKYRLQASAGYYNHAYAIVDLAHRAAPTDPVEYLLRVPVVGRHASALPLPLRRLRGNAGDAEARVPAARAVRRALHPVRAGGPLRRPALQQRPVLPDAVDGDGRVAGVHRRQRRSARARRRGADPHDGGSGWRLQHPRRLGDAHALLLPPGLRGQADLVGAEGRPVQARGPRRRPGGVHQQGLRRPVAPAVLEPRLRLGLPDDAVRRPVLVGGAGADAGELPDRARHGRAGLTDEARPHRGKGATVPSKGVDYYGFVGPDEPVSGASIAFTGPKVGSTLSAADNFEKNNLQIDSRNISWGFTGPFTWKVELDGQTVATETNGISSWTGNLESGSTMTHMLAMPPIRANGALIDYGFYDAGHGTSGLTNQDQSWVYCTRDLSSWMGDIDQRFPQVSDQPFSKFVLAGAHDSGMMTMATVDSVLSGAEAAALEIAIGLVLPEVAAAIALGDTQQVIMNASMPQKDSVADMMSLGCRYFDFRPGTMYPAILGYRGRFHQHLVIPGRPYVAFLSDLLRWLAANPTEIAIVSCNTQGFASADMDPSPDDLLADWNTAVAQTGVSRIARGDASSLDQTYGALIAAGVRVIFLDQIAGETTKYDSYTDAYATLTPQPIIDALNQMTTDGQQGSTYTVLQLQGTCTSIIQPEGFLSLSWTASPLMSTKAAFDAYTLPWVAANGSTNLRADKLVVLLNDFIDNATASTAIDWTLNRMGIDEPL